MKKDNGTLFLIISIIFAIVSFSWLHAKRVQLAELQKYDQQQQRALENFRKE